MKTSEANIEIIRDNEKLSSISVIMPTWHKIEDDNEFVTVNIPLFGLKTFAKNDDDTIVAINEALKCFCISSERFGQGIEKELQVLGWTFVKTEGNRTLLNYSIESNNFVFEQIMETGDQFAENDLAIA